MKNIFDLFKLMFILFSMGSIKDNLQHIREKVQTAAAKTGREAQDISIVAITKTIPVTSIAQAIDAGITDIGENRVQEAEIKRPAVGDGVHWHLVGHLQTNKVKKSVRVFDLIHSVDSERLAAVIDAEARLLHKIQPVLVQVNTSAEETKFGVAPSQVLELITRIMPFKNIAIQGLMTIGAWLSDPEQVRPCFKNLKKIQENITNQNLPGVEMRILSMGMTNDFVAAIEEGATMVRIGRGIFGERAG